VFKKDFTRRCSTHSNAFFESVEEVYQAPVVYEDKATCLQFAKMPILSPHTNHIGLSYHWFRSRVSSVDIDIDIQSVFSVDQLADQIT